jgi:hypothetical protein
MPGHIDFRFDEADEILFAHVHWKITTEQDVHEWFGQWETYFKREGLERVDCVIVVDGLEIAPSIGKLWGQYRALLVKNYTRFSFRVHENATVRTFTNTSGVLYNTATAEAKTIEDAIEGIKAARQQQIDGLLTDDFPTKLLFRRAKS